MPLFYAYIHNIRDDNTWHVLMVFSSRMVADEWWRAIAGSPHASYFQRINSQFYTHNPDRNVLGFFHDSSFKTISPPFRGKFFMTLMDNRDGKHIPIIPTLDYTDHISGNWFYIRSKSNHNMHWHLAGGILSISYTHRTQFQIEAKGLKDGTVMIGSDAVTFKVAPRCTVNVDGSGTLVESGIAYEFKFDDLEKGLIWVESNGNLSHDNTQRRGQQVSWELV